jgi:hypothetical protein
MHVPIFHRWLTRLWERWAERGSADAPGYDAQAQPVYRYNLRYRLTLAACFVLAVWLCWYAWSYPEAYRDRPAWLLWGVRIGLTLTVVVGIGEVADGFRWSASVRGTELVIERPFRRAQHIPLAGIRGLFEDPRKRELRIVHAAGESRISYHVNGLPQLRLRLQSFTAHG